MNEPTAPLPPPPTIEVVTVRAGEQLMSDMYQRINKLEADLEAAEREADAAERAAADADTHGPAFGELAQLLEQAKGLRMRGSAATSTPDEDVTGEANVLQLITDSHAPRHHIQR